MLVAASRASNRIYLITIARKDSVSRTYTKMSFKTQVLPAKSESIKFIEGQDLPLITDKETEKNLRIAANELIATNNVVGFPTETVYGLGASALNDESVKSIYRTKNRPADNPLIVHVSSVDQLKRRILPRDYEIPAVYGSLIEKFWPGPLTILLPNHEGSPISKVVTVNQDTFAVRIPQNPIARALIALSDTPLAAPSANASTRPSPTLASHVYHDLQGKIPYIIDGGPCNVGVESTVVDGLVSPPMLLRPGGISAEDIKKYGGEQWKDVQIAKRTAAGSEVVKTPGMKYKHYSPSATVVLFINCGDGTQAVNDYISRNNLSGSKIALLRSKHFKSYVQISPLLVTERELGSKGSEISRNLFKHLRDVDEIGVDHIFVEGIEEDNEGLAVMNRLQKAASATINGI